MEGNLALLGDAVRLASKFLQRDYFELENLQSSTKSTKTFVEKSMVRARENLQNSLAKYYKTIVFNSDLPEGKFTGPVALIEVLDGISNFERAIPFFSVAATVLGKTNDQIFAEKTIMNFPALGEIYYSEKGKGAWVEKHSANSGGASFRLRVSATAKTQDALVSCDAIQLKLAQKISANIRIFGSCAYQTALVVSGKTDCGLFSVLPASAHGLELILREAGGAHHMHNGVFIASNYLLHEKLKQLAI